MLPCNPIDTRRGVSADRQKRVVQPVEGDVVKERARRLREAGEAALRRRFAAEVGAPRNVLIESPTRGRTEHFMPVAISGEKPGAVVTRTISGHNGCNLLV